MNIEQALKETGFVRCEFKADGHDPCDKCNEPIKRGADVFYSRTCYEVDEGEYYCEACTINWSKDNETEEYNCPTCGQEETKFVGHPDTQCFDCYANRSGMPT